jgi:hypothetical protein
MHIVESVHISEMCVINHSVKGGILKVHERKQSGECPYGSGCVINIAVYRVIFQVAGHNTSVICGK